MTCVRLSDDERAQIEEDSINVGRSIPRLLRETYFDGPRPMTLMTKPDLTKLSAEIGRIGNNINQIAKRLNSGIRSGFYDEIAKAQESLDQIWIFLSSRFCRCKPLGK